MKSILKTIYYSIKYHSLVKESIVDLIEGSFKESQTKEIADYLIESFDYSKDKTNLIIYAENVIYHYSKKGLSREALKKHIDRIQTIINKLKSI